VVRLQKFLAEAGVASRRASEQIITSGRVTVNGAEASELGVKVDPAHDRVAVDGRLVKAKRKLYIALHKPPGYVCTRSDGQARDSHAQRNRGYDVDELRDPGSESAMLSERPAEPMARPIELRARRD